MRVRGSSRPAIRLIDCAKTACSLGSLQWICLMELRILYRPTGFQVLSGCYMVSAAGFEPATHALKGSPT